MVQKFVPGNLKEQEISLDSITRILDGCLRKEHKYQKMLYEHYYGFALKTVFRYIYRYDRATDVVNDGFIKFFKNIERFNAGPKEDSEKIFMGFLKRIMINTAIDELRKNKMSPEIGGIPDYVWDMDDASRTAEQKVLYKDLIKMIKELTPQYRSVFNLYVIDGYNHMEIADILQISVGTSKSSLHRARQILQTRIKKSEDEIECRM